MKIMAPTISIPRTRIKASVRPYNAGGSTVEYMIPTATSLIRPGFLSATCVAGQSNIMTAAGVATDGSLKMNRRYTIMDQLTITDSSSNVINVTVNFKPDSRDQFFGEAVFLGDPGAADAAISSRITITGHVNYDTGDVTLQGTISAGAAAALTYSLTSARIKARFVPVNTMQGRTTVKITNEMTDITIDPNEDFLIELTQEEIQDYRSIFKIDLARTLSEAIKRQILLNKDYDLA